jgi:xylulokinase
VGSGKGLQKSRIWSQISADLFGKPLRVTGYESAVFGAALMAGLGVGAIDNLDEFPRSIVYSTETIPESAPMNFYRNEFLSYWRNQIKSL